MYAQSQRGDNTVQSVQGQDSEHLARGRGGQGSRPVLPHQARNHPSSHFLPLTLPTSPNCGMCRRLKAGVLIWEGFVLYITAVDHNHLPCFQCVFSEDNRTPYTLSTVAMTSDQNKRHGGRLVSLPVFIAWVLFFILVLSLDLSRPEASVNLEIICCGAGWGHIWVGFDGFVHYNLLADSTFSSRCAQEFYLLSSSCPQQI